MVNGTSKGVVVWKPEIPISSLGNNKVKIIFLAWSFLATEKKSIAKQYLFGDETNVCRQNVH